MKRLASQGIGTRLFFGRCMSSPYSGGWDSFGMFVAPRRSAWPGEDCIGPERIAVDC